MLTQYLLRNLSSTRKLGKIPTFVLTNVPLQVSIASVSSLSPKRIPSPSLLSPNRIKSLNREFKACLKLLSRSGYRFPIESSVFLPNLVLNRNFHTSKLLKNQQRNNESGQNENTNDPNKNKNNENDRKLIGYGLAWMIFGYTIISIISILFPPANKPDVLRYVSWNEFYHQMLAKGEVELIVVKPNLDLVTIYLYEGAVIRGKKAPYRSYHMNIFNVPSFEQKLRDAEKNLGIPPDKSVQIIYERNQESIMVVLGLLIATVALIAFFTRSSSMAKSPLNSNMFSNLRKAKFTVIDPLLSDGKGVRFSDVAGLKEAKVEIAEFVDYLKNPDRFKALGAKVPRGVLLLGPPGCGKTMLAKAVSTEASVPFLAMNGSEFIEMIGGLGAARVRDLFKEARKRAPCIVYIDEIDAIGRKRSSEGFGGSTGEGEQTLNQLLVEMDGMSQREGIIMLASTNRADILDRALLRPGRFDRHILIDYPTLQERNEIFIHHLRPIKLEHKPEDYSARLAQLTPGFSGADIANIANESALHAARIGKKVVQSDDLEIAIERVVGGLEKRSGVMSAHEKRVIAFHECGHALIGWLLPHTDALLKVSIVPRTTNVLGFARYLPSDRKLYSTEELFERMCMALGGRVAEILTFNHTSSGAQDDLKKVTKLAYSKVQMYGMDPVIGQLSFDYEENKFGKKPFSRKLANTIDSQARLLVGKAFKETEKILTENQDKLKMLAEALLEREVLNYKDIEKLIGPPPHGPKNFIESFDLNSMIDQGAGKHLEPKDPEDNDQGPRSEDGDRDDDDNGNRPNDKPSDGKSNVTIGV